FFISSPLAIALPADENLYIFSYSFPKTYCRISSAKHRYRMPFSDDQQNPGKQNLKNRRRGATTVLCSRLPPESLWRDPPGSPCPDNNRRVWWRQTTLSSPDYWRRTGSFPCCGLCRSSRCEAGLRSSPDKSWWN